MSGWSLIEKSNHIFYGVEDEAAALDLERRLSEMQAPCFLVAVRVMGRIQLNSAPQH
ncbi:MAG: hypothetical protein ABIS15_00915 [Gemmatimonadaceae bacterium]